MVYRHVDPPPAWSVATTTSYAPASSDAVGGAAVSRRWYRGTSPEPITRQAITIGTAVEWVSRFIGRSSGKVFGTGPERDRL
jgi:hypothetical protein